MSIGYYIFLGVTLLISLAYAALGAAPVLLVFWIVLALVSVFVTLLMNSTTIDGRPVKLRHRLKGHKCYFCDSYFWTCKNAVAHERRYHPQQKKMQEAYYKSIAQRHYGPRVTKVYHPDAYLKPCTWCGGEGYKFGVMCEECGGTGKMFR